MGLVVGIKICDEVLDVLLFIDGLGEFVGVEIAVGAFADTPWDVNVEA